MKQQPSEDSLIRKAITGDRAAVERLLVAYHDRLSRHIQRGLPDDLRARGCADELLQDTFVRAIRSIQAFAPRSDSSFYAWLKTIAKRLTIDLLRREALAPRAQIRQRSAPQDGSGSWSADLLQQVAAITTTASRKVRRRETQQILLVALAGLPPRYRTVLKLHYLHDQSIPQIARAMDCTTEAVRGLLHRAKKQLREAIGAAARYSLP